MSSTASEAPIDGTLELAPAPSARALQLLFWLHALPLALLMFALPEGVPMIIAAVGVGASWLWLRRHPVFGFGPRALNRLTWHADGDWSVHQRGGAHQKASLLGHSVLAGDFILLNFRCEDGRRCSRALLGDELEDEVQRRLRARLRLIRKAA